MAYGEIMDVPIKIGEISDPDSYYKSLPGSALVMKVFDNEFNLVARALGMSWSENYQNFPVMELGQRYCVEIVKGAMPPGQLNIQGLFLMQFNDTLPTAKNLVSNRELSALVQIADHEDSALSGIVLDVFKGCVFQGQQGNFNSTSLYLRNANLIFRTRMTGLEWKQKNPSLKYAAKPGGFQSVIGPANTTA
mgnify:CR=1 FL=1